LLRGVYLFDPDLYDDLPRRVAYRAALLAEGPGSCLVGVSAARMWGLQGLPPSDDEILVALVGGGSRRRLRGLNLEGSSMPPVVVRQLPILPGEVVLVDGLSVRALGRTVVDAALDLDRPEALSVLDSALHLELLSHDRLADEIADAKGRPGIARVRGLANIADARAESPLESRIRLICVDGEVAPDELQYPVHDDGGRLAAVADMGWIKGRRRPLFAEADGQVHALPSPVFRDRRRGNFLVAAESDTVRFVWADALRPRYVLHVVRSALSVAG